MIEEFRNTFRNRHQALRQEADQGRKVAGWVCTYVPEEILYAAGMLPVRVVGGGGDTSAADAHLYSNVCSFARGCLEEGLSERYDFLEAYVTVNTCDNIRRLYDVWSHYLKTPMTHILALPHKVTETSMTFFRQELERFKDHLEQHTGRKITDDDLQGAIATYNRTRQLLRQLYALRKSDAPPISGTEILEVVLAAMQMDKATYNQKLEQLLEELSGRQGDASGKIRLLVVGSELDSADYLQTIEEQGGIVVADDLCNGTRYFMDLVEPNGDPLETLARRYLTKGPCARMRPATERFQRIRQMIQEYNVQGIIYEVIKFCDIYGEDYPLFRDEVKELGVPVLSLSREATFSGVGQLKTRVQAFFESIN